MKHIPNILTLSNLFCGSIACILAVKGNFPELILILLCASLIFDFFDGFVARAVKASGAMGKELDSLADMVSFGLLPGVLIFSMLGGNFTYEDTTGGIKSLFSVFKGFSFFSLFVPLFSAYRLAKFNLDQEQAYYFKGLPTPANTIFIFSLYWLIAEKPGIFWNDQILLLMITAFSCIILVSNLPLMSLKFSNFTWKDNSLVFSFLFISLGLFLLFQISAIPFIIIIYIILSIIFRKKIISNGVKTT
ncbi:MAG: CDP-alcohol phosphatidyltransferase family protein [Flavobacteriaceae bacterium]|jgi:CDP-diacylglycerol--serine O-phosphatidyltransferase|nr:CDP-alcohol phosphatidyltransferase family protein [Flavobacteriaceae bacterium]